MTLVRSIHAVKCGLFPHCNTVLLCEYVTHWSSIYGHCFLSYLAAMSSAKNIIMSFGEHTYAFLLDILTS